MKTALSSRIRPGLITAIPEAHSTAGPASMAVQDPRIVLTWITRLRWLAIAGQILAIAMAYWGLSFALPLVPLAAVILFTALTNFAVMGLLRFHTPRPWLVPVLLLLDVSILTVLLYFTGGPDNPFTTLYLVHIAMAAVAVGPTWTFIVAGTAAAGYGLLFQWHQPLGSGEQIEPKILSIGNWTALALVTGLIAYFIGRVTRALRSRELELAQVRERTARMEQLASLTTLAAGAAHELGTPLGTIAVVAKEMELSAVAGADSSSIAEDARLVRREVDRMRSILDAMRVSIVDETVSRPMPFKVADLLPLLADDLAEDQRARLTIQPRDTQLSVIAPLGALRQALIVLVRNALDASPRNEPVTLEVQDGGEYVDFVVLDQGVGMTREVLRRAGEPFFTTKDPGKGMGLGLFLVRLLADRYGGVFNLESKPGEGTRATLQLPKASL